MFHNQRIISLLALLIVVSLVLAACPAPAAQAPAGQTGGEQAASGEAKAAIKVGAIFDLTGATSDVGTGYAEGVQAYVKWVNANGGLEGHPIELLSQDYGYKVDVAEQLYSQFIGEGVVAFQGWGTGDTEALRTKIAADQIPFMSASYSAALNSQTDAPYNFLVGTTYSDQLVLGMKWAIEDWKAKGKEGAPKFAIFHHASPFGQSPVADGEAFAKANGTELKAIEMPKGATDLTPELTQAKEFGANYIAIQNVSSPAALLLKNKKSLGMDDVQVICLNWCSNEILVKLSEGAAEGVVGAMPFTPLSVDVPGQKELRDYAKANNLDLDKLGSTFAFGWQVMSLMAEGIRMTIKAGKEITGPNIKASLETLKGFDTQGVSAPVTFTAEDHRANRSLRLFQVKDGKWTQLTDFLRVE